MNFWSEIVQVHLNMTYNLLRKFWFPERKQGRNQLYVGWGMGYLKFTAQIAEGFPTLLFNSTRFADWALVCHIFSGTWFCHTIQSQSHQYFLVSSLHEMFKNAMFSVKPMWVISHLPICIIGITGLYEVIHYKILLTFSYPSKTCALH